MSSPRRGAVKVPGDDSIVSRLTDIDRRTCHREVPLKVLCLGLSRTGTSSLREALLDLGYVDTYHYSSIVNVNPRDAEMWNEAMEAKFENKGKPFERPEWDQLLGHCMAVTDTPCVIFYEELLDAYPDASIILTVRDSPQQWHRSFVATLGAYFIERDKQQGIYRLFAPAAPSIFNSAERFAQLLYEHYWTKDVLDKETQFYERHIENVLSAAKKRGRPVLVYNVKEGWEPLCKHLGHPVPSAPFPRMNDSATFRANILPIMENTRQAMLWNIAKTAAASVAVLGIGVVAAQRWEWTRALLGRT